MTVCDRCRKRIAGHFPKICLVSETDNQNYYPDLCDDCGNALLRLIAEFKNPKPQAEALTGGEK